LHLSTVWLVAESVDSSDGSVSNEPPVDDEVTTAEEAAIEKANDILEEKKEAAISAASLYFMCEDKVKTLQTKVEEQTGGLAEAKEMVKKMKSDDEEVVIPIGDDAEEFTPERAFSVFDANKSGGIDKAELKNAIAAVNDVITAEDEIDAVMSKYDLNTDGELGLDEFRKLCKSKKLNLKKRRTSMLKKVVVQSKEDAAAVRAIKEELIIKELIMKAEKAETDTAAALEASKEDLLSAETTLTAAEGEHVKAKKEVERQEKVLEDIKNDAWSAERVFAAFDADKNGTLDISELQLALTALLGSKVSEETTKKFAKKYDKDGDGNLDFEEFSTCSTEARKSPAVFFNNVFAFGNDKDGGAREKVEEMEKGEVEQLRKEGTGM